MNFLRYLLSKNFREEFSRDTMEKFHLAELQMDSIYNKESFANEKSNINLHKSNVCECISCQCCAA